jgi:hypothetical protein
MAAAFGQYLDPRSVLEVPGGPLVFGHLPARVDSVNHLTHATVIAQVESMKASVGNTPPALKPMRIHTGGAPSRDALLSRFVGGQAHAKAAATVELATYAAGGASKLNCGTLLWRYYHGGRKVPVGVEVSHLAEAYHIGEPVGFKVEVSELESSEVNESRKVCTKFGLMWYKANGDPIEPHERFEDDAGNANPAPYIGPTLCPHKGLGSPCYAPYPIGSRVPTFLSPGRDRAGGSKMGGGKGSGGGGAKKSKGEKRKESGTPDPTAKRSKAAKA